MSAEYVGPSLWHGREVNSCTRCKYLRCQLMKSGRHPDYHYFCMHPTVLDSKHNKNHFAKLIEKAREIKPEMVEHFELQHAKHIEEVAKYGEFISNDSYTPETPEWCPVVVEKMQKQVVS